MIFLLSSQNIFEYLIEQGLCEPKEQQLGKIKPKSAKNFNLLVSLPNARHLLVKQEPHDRDGETDGEFLYEWRIHELLQTFPELSHIRPLISEAIHFDPARSIIVFNYLDDYVDLRDFYDEEEVFPPGIAAAIGASLAAVHRPTLDSQKYKDFLSQTCEDIQIDKVPNFVRRLKRIEPELFGVVSADALKFFRLYQRYESIGQAIAELNEAFEPCCLTHDDLKLDNILLHSKWEQALSTAETSPLASLSKGGASGDTIVRLIDWEKWTWGDPAFDLGTIISNYLRIWLSSLAIGPAIDMETALRLATIPLEEIQPSIAALIKAYFDNFPEILERRPDFLTRVVQFTGLALIRKIQVKIHYKDPLGNKAIAMLQVAKTLLCRPEQSIPTVFGATESELTAPMQLLDSPPNQLPDALEDIASQVQIESNFCISHPDGDSLEIPAEVVAHLEQLSIDLRNRYLSWQLTSFLHNIYYSDELETNPTADVSSVSSPLENDSVSGLNLEFYEGLDESNCSKGYFDPGWSVLRQERNGSLAVEKNGLTVHIKRDRHLQPAQRSVTVGEVVAIRMPHNLIDGRFYVAVGNAGLVNRSDRDGDCQSVNIYFNLSPEGAIALMGAITGQLNAIPIPFTFKVFYNPDDYQRCDSGVLCFERSNYETVRQVLQTVYGENQSHFGMEVPLFTKCLAPGLGLAEEPDCQEGAPESFGMNRCQIVANGLLDAWQKGEDSPEARMVSIQQQFSRLGIDWQRPYLNANSADIYTPLKGNGCP